MLQLTRPGPRLLRLEGDAGLADWIMKNIKGAQRFDAWEELEGWTSHDSAVTCLTPEGESCKIKVPSSTGNLLAAVINTHCCGLVEKVERLPRIQLFRVQGNAARVISQIADRFGGQELTLDNLFDSAAGSGLTLCFTRQSLLHPVSHKDLLPIMLRLEGDVETLQEGLQRQALNLFNVSMGDAPWTVLEIRIYDIYNRYEVQRRRLVTALEDLDIGLILGEGWSRDYARVLLPLDIYAVKLYTFLDPIEVKKKLVGLEWDEFGNRLADYDLYNGREKVSWGDARGKEKMPRPEFAARCREETLAALCPAVLDTIKSCDRQLRDRERQLGGTPKEG